MSKKEYRRVLEEIYIELQLRAIFFPNKIFLLLNSLFMRQIPYENKLKKQINIELLGKLLDLGCTSITPLIYV